MDTNYGTFFLIVMAFMLPGAIEEWFYKIKRKVKR